MVVVLTDDGGGAPRDETPDVSAGERTRGGGGDGRGSFHYTPPHEQYRLQHHNCTTAGTRADTWPIGE